MNKRVAVIGGRPAPIHGAKELGIDVVLVHEEGGYEPEILEHCEQVVHADTTDGPAIVKALTDLHEQRPFDRILTTTEFSGESTGFAVDHFGLPGVSERTAHLLKNKSAMRELLAAASLSPVEYATVRSEDDVVDFVRRHGRSVLKPADGVASLHINICDDEASASRGLAALRAANIDNVIVEEYLEGPVVSVDSFSFDGRHLPIGYSEYRMNDKFVEWEVSTPSSVAQPWLTELRDMTRRLLDAVGLQEGPAHSEFILTRNGPRVLESHARLAGSGAPELVRRAFGLDLNRMFLTVPLGIDVLPEEPPEPIAGAVVQFFVPDAGRVNEVEVRLPDNIVVKRTTPGQQLPVFMPFLFHPELQGARRAVVVQKHPGDVVPPLNTVADCVSGYAVATAEDRASAVAAGDELVVGVRFGIEQSQ